jgi:hypothetical protein
MKSSYQRNTIIALCLLLMPVLARAQTTTRTVSQPAPSEPAAVDPEAVSALRKMSDYLRTLNVFQVSGVITVEHVLEDSQKIQLTKVVDLVASRPNNVYARIRADAFERQMFYDGATFTLYAPFKKFYATVPAPPTIVELADMLEDKHGIDLPLVDLFRWGTAASRLSEITAAKDIGESACDGVTCQHYAFRQAGLDWEIWIQNGDYPLPRRIVLTTTSEEERPQHTSTYSWNLAPSFNKETFTFVAPPDAKKITLVDFTAKPVAAGDKK